MTARKQWFLDRIGKRVYRNYDGCDCFTCTKIYRDGLIIEDETHAAYLAGMEADYAIDGDRLKYFDTKEEVINFENK